MANDRNPVRIQRSMNVEASRDKPTSYPKETLQIHTKPILQRQSEHKEEKRQNTTYMNNTTRHT